MRRAFTYILIAVTNVNRAAFVRTIVAESLGLDVTIVHDGDAAIHEMAECGLPMLLVVDLSLPRVDGFTVVRHVRRQATGPLPHVIAMSAHESLRMAAHTLAATLQIDAV